MGDYTPTVAAFRGVYGQMCAEWCRDDALAEFDRFIARVKAEALREALMSDETVERAARALCWQANEWEDGQVVWETPEQIAEEIEEWVPLARAALTATIGGGDE